MSAISGLFKRHQPPATITAREIEAISKLLEPMLAELNAQKQALEPYIIDEEPELT